METLEQQFNSRVRVFLGLHGRESDDVRHEGAGRPEPDAPDRRRTLAVAEDGGPGSGVRGGLRPGLGRPSDSAPRPPAPEAFVTGEENEEEQSDDRRATYGRTGVRKRRGGPMRTLALRRCARVLRSKPRHGHVLRLHVQAESHDASYRPVESITYYISALYDLSTVPSNPHNIP